MSRGSQIKIDIPGYHIVRPIGRGGMATVYLAIQKSFQREVALKVMSPALSEDSSFSERFLREARIVSRLVHPHIVTVHDVGIQNGHHFLSMEYIEGHDLKERLPSLKGEQLFRIAKEVAKALDYAGRKGYVHRDVKPENIMIHNLDGRAILMDFGIARAADSVSTMTRTGTALGTPHYMSPEQAKGDAIDGRSDLYSLGVLLYYMLTGRVPYEADSPVAVGIKHVSAPVPQLPEALSCYQHLIEKTMAKAPSDRYQTGSELVEALSMVDVHELDRWRPTQGFEYLGSHEHTPLRSDQIDLVSGSLPLSGAGVSPPSAGVASVSGTMILPAENIQIPEEDLADRQVASRSGFSPLLIGLTLCVAAGVGYYFYSEHQRSLVIEANKLSIAAVAKSSESIVEPETLLSSVVKPKVDADGTVLAENTMLTVSGDNPQQGESEASSNINAESSPQSAPQQPVVADDLAADPVAELLAKAKTLNPQLDQQIETMPELLALYRQVLLLQPDQRQAQEALLTLQQQSIDLAAIQVDVGENEAASASLGQALAWFPALAEDSDFLQLQQRLQQSTEVTELLSKARRYFDRDRLLRPAGENALELYQQVLAQDAGNALAQKGINNIVIRYGELAEVASQRHNFKQALTFVDSGLSVKNSEALQVLREQLLIGQQQEQAVQLLLVEAESLAQQQRWFTTTNSAAEKYQQLLLQQPGRQEAIDGMGQLLNLVVAESKGLIAVKDYDQALSLVASALVFLPKETKLRDLQQLLQSMGPVIDRLLVSGVAISDTSAVTADKISADRTLYIAFNFANMGQPTSVLQAVLFDGARSVQIAAVPVVVVGEEGSVQFRFERPVEGFTDGGYIMDILLAGERIFSNAFVIDN